MKKTDCVVSDNKDASQSAQSGHYNNAYTVTLRKHDSLIYKFSQNDIEPLQ